LKPPGWGFPKDKVKDIPIRIRPNPFLGQPERVMERIQWEETPRLGVSEGIRLRIGPNPFLGQHEKGYGKDTTARLEVSGRIRTFKIESAQVLFLGRPKRVLERIPRQETPQSGVSGCYKYGSSKFKDKEIERLRFQFNDFISVIYKIFYRLQRFQKERRKNSGPRNNH
jgi:hypothetical protein